MLTNFVLHLPGKDYGLKEKVLFWKTYRSDICKTINTMRSSDTNRFKINFIAGNYSWLYKLIQFDLICT